VTLYNNLVLYVCDECDATWERLQDIDAIKGQCLGIIMDEYGVGAGTLNLLIMNGWMIMKISNDEVIKGA